MSCSSVLLIKPLEDKFGAKSPLAACNTGGAPQWGHQRLAAPPARAKTFASLEWLVAMHATHWGGYSWGPWSGRSSTVDRLEGAWLLWCLCTLALQDVWGLCGHSVVFVSVVPGLQFSVVGNCGAGLLGIRILHSVDDGSQVAWLLMASGCCSERLPNVKDLPNGITSQKEWAGQRPSLLEESPLSPEAMVVEVPTMAGGGARSLMRGHAMDLSVGEWDLVIFFEDDPVRYWGRCHPHPMD